MRIGDIHVATPPKVEATFYAPEFLFFSYVNFQKVWTFKNDLFINEGGYLLKLNMWIYKTYSISAIGKL